MLRKPKHGSLVWRVDWIDAIPDIFSEKYPAESCRSLSDTSAIVAGALINRFFRQNRFAKAI